MVTFGWVLLVVMAVALGLAGWLWPDLMLPDRIVCATAWI